MFICRSLNATSSSTDAKSRFTVTASLSTATVGYLRRTAPDQHREEVQAGYIKGLVEEAPAVITLNMRAAAATVNEYVAGAFPFRLDRNENYARTEFSLAACEEEYSTEDSFTKADNSYLLARGDLEPLLGLPALKRRRKAVA